MSKWGDRSPFWKQTYTFRWVNSVIPSKSSARRSCKNLRQNMLSKVCPTKRSGLVLVCSINRFTSTSSFAITRAIVVGPGVPGSAVAIFVTVGWIMCKESAAVSTGRGIYGLKICCTCNGNILRIFSNDSVVKQSKRAKSILCVSTKTSTSLCTPK